MGKLTKTGRKVYLIRRVARVTAFNADHAMGVFRMEENDFNEIEREITYEYDEMKDQDEMATEAEEEDDDDDEEEDLNGVPMTATKLDDDEPI